MKMQWAAGKLSGRLQESWRNGACVNAGARFRFDPVLSSQVVGGQIVSDGSLLVPELVINSFAKVICPRTPAHSSSI
jgi:hypothetical protein